MNLLIIGSQGSMGKNHLRVSKKLLRTAVHELKTCDKEGKVDYNDYKKAIKEFIPTHVIIATPTPTHGEILDYCVKMNVPNVLIEKPIIDGYDAMKYMDAKPTKIMVGHIERYNPVILIMQNLLKGKEIDTIICTRSGLIKEEPDFNLHLDLCIHDIDVCQVLTSHMKFGSTKMLSKNIKSNSCNLLTNINGADCFFHADNKSPFKRRDIKVMGPGFFCEADYMNQTLTYNGERIPVTKEEPLKIELIHFFYERITKQDLLEAIINLRIARG